MRELRPFELEVFFSKWEFTARHHLCASDMQSMTLTELLALADDADRKAWDSLYLGYTETWGGMGLREAIASTYERVAPADVLTFVGAQEAIFAAMHALLRPEDHAIVVIPNYQSVESVPVSICDTTGIALDAARNWELDLGRVRDAIRPNTRVISFNFPHNPTGKVISRATLDALVAMARERGIYLFSDEVYRGVERRPEMMLPQVADLYERGISLGVMSKSYGLPGIRVGWVACRDREALGAHGADEALHVDLRSGAERIACADRTQGAGADSGTQPGADREELADAGGFFRGTSRFVRLDSSGRWVHRVSTVYRARRRGGICAAAGGRERRAVVAGERVPIGVGRDADGSVPDRIWARQHGSGIDGAARASSKGCRLNGGTEGCRLVSAMAGPAP